VAGGEKYENNFKMGKGGRHRKRTVRVVSINFKIVSWPRRAALMKYIAMGGEQNWGASYATGQLMAKKGADWSATEK